MDKCCLCGNVSGIEWHHTIQQAHGGVNSEQVPLCGGHHGLVHKLALELYRTRDELALAASFPADVPAEKHELLMILVRRLVNGRLAFEKAKESNPNLKRAKVMVSLDPSRLHKVEKLTRILGQQGGRISRERVIQAAIDRLYQSATQKEKASLKEKGKPVK